MTSSHYDFADLPAGLSGMAVDSRQITAGNVFLAYPGEQTDGRRHIDAAIAAGAAAVLWEPDRFVWQSDPAIPNRPIPGLRARAGELAADFYGHPSRQLPVIAVTGTNGKTTIAHFIAQLLTAAGKPAGLVGTLGAGTLDKLQPLKQTTPDAVSQQRLMRRFVRQRLSAAVIEASSHGITQGRLNGLHLTTGIFSNAGRDHLDYHRTLDDYWRSKAALFDHPGMENAILNADDDYCRSLAEPLRPRQRVMTYGWEGNDLRLIAIEDSDGGGCRLRTDGINGEQSYSLPFRGEHNIGNFLAAVLAATLLEAAPAALATAATALTLPAGRMETIHTSPTVIVDFAHTPDAMAALLSTFRRHDNRRLLIVLGCGGERDRDKRPEMGCLGARMADLLYVTDDNPRHEDPAAIRADILRQAPDAIEIADRRQAILAALAVARPQDTILILGKGHENYQEIGDRRLPFSDAAIVREWFAGGTREAPCA